MERKIDLESLIRSKSFEELSATEKACVLSSMSKADYNYYYNLGFLSAEILKNKTSKIVVRDSTKKILISKFAKPKVNILFYKIPTYQVMALAAILIVVFYFFIPGYSSKAVINNNSAYLVDTIYQIVYKSLPAQNIQLSSDTSEKKAEIVIKEIKWTEQAIREPENDQANSVALVKSPNSFQMDLGEFLNEKKTGRSLANDSLLSKYMNTAATIL